MPERDELDRYQIPRALRVKLYLGSLSMTITLVIILGWLLHRCVGDKDEIRKESAADVRDILTKELEKADKKFSPQIEEVQRQNEELTKQLDSLKKNVK